MALTKSDIIAAVHDLGLTKKKSVEVIESLLEIIKRSLESSEDVLISGFGKFCVKDKAKRKGRNPATGEDLMLRDRRVVTFKCSGKLRNKIDGLEYSDNPDAGERGQKGSLLQDFDVLSRVAAGYQSEMIAREVGAFYKSASIE